MIKVRRLAKGGKRGDLERSISEQFAVIENLNALIDELRGQTKPRRPGEPSSGSENSASRQEP
jgi:hypothetical protein